MYENYKEILKQKLNADRYYHSLCVADSARDFAEKFGCDTEKAYLTGLLHDITKNLSESEQLQMLDGFGIILTEIERKAPKLWHAISGAAYIEKVLGITDKEIISAVRYHTTARENMTLPEKILYMADFISADRDYPDVDVLRGIVKDSFSDGMIYALKYTINELTERGVAIHPDTVAAYNRLILDKSEGK